MATAFPLPCHHPNKINPTLIQQQPMIAALGMKGEGNTQRKDARRCVGSMGERRRHNNHRSQQLKHWPALVYQNLAELGRDISPAESKILKAKLILEHCKWVQ